jgi:AcrR family transcriptional regulator
VPSALKCQERYSASVDSLRERKKRRSREHVSRIAITLFAERGLQSVTVDEICDRADVARRSFFRYFASKEDAVFPNDRERRAVFRDALAEEGEGETLSGAARRAVQALLDHDLREDRETARLRAELLAKEPALVGHLALLTSQWAAELTEVAARRLGTAEQDRADARLAVGALLGTLSAAGELWLANRLRGDPRVLADRALEIVERGLARTLEIDRR